VQALCTSHFQSNKINAKVVNTIEMDLMMKAGKNAREQKPIGVVESSVT
jgi:hypothetical protein